MRVMFATKHAPAVYRHPEFIRFVVRLTVAGDVEIYPAPQLRVDEIFDPRLQLRPLHLCSPSTAHLTPELTGEPPSQKIRDPLIASPVQRLVMWPPPGALYYSPFRSLPQPELRRAAPHVRTCGAARSSCLT